MKAFYLSLLALLVAACSSGVKTDKGSYVFSADSITYKVEFFSPRCVHIQSLPQGDTLQTVRLVVDADKQRYEKSSYKESGDAFVFATDELTVTFQRETGAFQFTETASGRVLLKEKENGARTFRRAVHGDEACLEVTQHFVPSADEALYGLGQYQNGVMNYRGDSVSLLQANMDVVNPFLISTAGYGILWDNYSATRFKDSSDGFSFASEVADASDYYFMAGKDMDSVMAEYRSLTGDVPMFGKWVFGFWQSKERYKSFAELEGVVKEYRKRGIPLDNIVQDWEYWGEKPYWNRLAFDSKNFDKPEEVIARLHDEMNVHFMLSVWLGFGPKTEVYHELDLIGALFDEKTWAGYKIFDAYNPAARDIVWRYMKEGLYDKGVDAWWADATEPSFRDGFTQEKQTERTKSAGKTHLGSFHRYLNTYSLVMLKDWYTRLRNESADKRVFIFTRSAFASQQRYGTAIWSGDVSASWQNMHKQLTAGLNLSMSGIPYWTSDTGGFFVTERDAQYPDGLKSDEYKELYSRWFQFGAFTPIFRAHGTNVPREIWQFGQPGTPYYDNQLKYISLRYRLLPYIYSLSYKVTTEGYTMMRGLAMDFASDRRTYDIDNAYMFGPSLLVRPVFSPMKEETEVVTYLPEHEGKMWFDFWTGEVIKAGTKHTQPSRLDVLPLYVKGGSIIPLAQVKQYAMEHPDDELELRVYAGTDASFLWYDDEGDSYRYEKNICSKVMIKWNEAEQKLVIGKCDGTYPGMPVNVNVTVRLYRPHIAGPIVKKCVYTGVETELNFK